MWVLAQTTMPSDGTWYGDFMTYAIQMLQWFVSWVMTFMFDAGSWVLDLLISAVPTSLWPNFAGISHYLALANAWIPIDLALQAFGSYFVFLACFVTVKFILKLIPTIG